MGHTYITTIFDDYLKWFEYLGGVRHVLTEIPSEMLVSIDPESNDWGIWKPIPSVLSEKDFQKVEEHLNLNLPESFKMFLSYKHFVGLQLGDIVFFNNKPTWAKDYLERINDFPVDIRKEKLIPIGDLNDVGLACFDLRNKDRLIWLNHEDDYDYRSKQFLADDFEDLFKTFDEHLIEWKKNHNATNQR